MGYTATYTLSRGASWSSSIIQSQYNAIVTAWNNAVNGINFAENAGIPEYCFRFVTHTHEDGSLAADSVGEYQVDFSTAKRVQWVKTAHATGVKIITGRVIGPSMTFGASKRRVQFGQGSTAGSEGFLPGTEPKVFLTLVYSGADFTSSSVYRVFPIEISSTGFSYRYETSDITNTGKFWYIDYMAIGAAPGFIASPYGVKA